MRKVHFLSLLILSIIACCIEIDISVPSFPDMAAYFSASEMQIQMTIAYNFLGFCFAALFYGPLSESFGRRRLMIIGNACLLLGAAGCAFSPSIQFLWVARFLQGIGAATSAVLVFAIVADVYKGSEATKIIAVMNAIITVCMAIAPVSGAFINEAIGWRGNYGVVALISLVSWCLLVIFLPETKPEVRPFKPIDIWLDYKKILSSIPFLCASFIPTLMYSAFLSFVASASFLYIDTFGLSIRMYALHQGFIVAAFSLVSLYSNSVIVRYGAKQCVLAAIIIAPILSTVFILVTLFDPHSPYLITGIMSLYCVCFAVCYPAIFSRSMEIFPEIKGTASSAIMGMRAFISSAFLVLSGYLYNGEPFRVALVGSLAILLVIGLAISLLKNQVFWVGDVN